MSSHEIAQEIARYNSKILELKDNLLIVKEEEFKSAILNHYLNNILSEFQILHKLHGTDYF
ncbi:hypothetical protein ABTM69_20900, partial [Acinetobacter baumannii]